MAKVARTTVKMRRASLWLCILIAATRPPTASKIVITAMKKLGLKKLASAGEAGVTTRIAMDNIATKVN